MKLIKDEIFNSLSERASGYDQIINALSQEGVIKSEEITPDMILSAMAVGSSELENQLHEASGKISLLEKEINKLTQVNSDLEKQVKNLTDGPAENPATLNHVNESGAQEEDIAVFADRHAGDTITIANEMKKRGLK